MIAFIEQLESRRMCSADVAMVAIGVLDDGTTQAWTYVPTSSTTKRTPSLVKTLSSGSSQYKLLKLLPPSGTRSYTINPKNSAHLSTTYIRRAVSRAAETWDKATPRELFANRYRLNTSAAADRMDGQNVIAFRKRGDNGIVAWTTLYYNPRTRRITEFDIVFNISYGFGDAGQRASARDLQGAAAHEFGHVMGLDDLSSTKATSQTMYAYSATGDTSKRSLASGDITGLRAVLRSL